MTQSKEDQGGAVPPVSERINLLFDVWRTSDGSEKSNDEVAAAMSAGGADVTAQELAAAREGSVPLDDKVLGALAGQFTVDEIYLLSDDVASLHEQLVLLREVGTSGIKGIHLRGDQSQVDALGLADLLRRLRERTTDTN